MSDDGGKTFVCMVTPGYQLWYGAKITDMDAALDSSGDVATNGRHCVATMIRSSFTVPDSAPAAATVEVNAGAVNVTVI